MKTMKQLVLALSLAGLACGDRAVDGNTDGPAEDPALWWAGTAYSYVQGFDQDNATSIKRYELHPDGTFTHYYTPACQDDFETEWEESSGRWSAEDPDGERVLLLSPDGMEPFTPLVGHHPEGEHQFYLERRSSEDEGCQVFYGDELNTFNPDGTAWRRVAMCCFVIGTGHIEAPCDEPPPELEPCP